jgi:hypothetical protein
MSAIVLRFLLFCKSQLGDRLDRGYNKWSPLYFSDGVYGKPMRYTNNRLYSDDDGDLDVDDTNNDNLEWSGK